LINPSNDSQKKKGQLEDKGIGCYARKREVSGKHVRTHKSRIKQLIMDQNLLLGDLNRELYFQKLRKKKKNDYFQSEHPQADG